MTFAEIPPGPLDASTVEVLRTGNERQRAVHRCVSSRNILTILSKFHGVLASTIALGVDVPSSDLDFLCETLDLDYFSQYVQKHFGEFEGFRSVPTPTPDTSRCYSFWLNGFEIEIFGSLDRLENQLGFRHHVVMARLINIGGNEFRTKLRCAKLEGVRTEPAIAKILSLPGVHTRASPLSWITMMLR